METSSDDISPVKPESLCKNIHFFLLSLSRTQRWEIAHGGVEHHGTCTSTRTRSHLAEPYGQSHHREVHEDAPAKLWQVPRVSGVCCSIPDLSLPRGGRFRLNASATPRRRRGCTSTGASACHFPKPVFLSSGGKKNPQGRGAAGIHHKRDKRARPGTAMPPLNGTQQLQSHRFKLRHFSLP